MNRLSETYSIETLCLLFGKTRQAYYKHYRKVFKKQVNQDILIQKTIQLRNQMPALGVRKLHYLIMNELPLEHQIGRDAFFNLLRDHGYLLRRRKRTTRTTFASPQARYYPNLAKDNIPMQSGMLFVSDITYIPFKDDFLYLSLLTDGYSRQILGWSLSRSLDTDGPLEALRMALLTRKPEAGCIHHSDRGCQYCSHRYVNMLKRNKIQISMTQNGDPRENAIAERVNGILKMEWLNRLSFRNFEQAKVAIDECIHLYNTKRPHYSLGMKTPVEAANEKGGFNVLWQSYYKYSSPGERPSGKGGGYRPTSE